MNSILTSPHHRAVLVLVFANFLWSIAGVVTRHLDSARSFEVTFWRSFFCAVALLSWFLYSHGRGALRYIQQSGKVGALSGFMWAIMFTCFMLALTLTSTYNTLIVNALTPFIAAVLARFFLKTPIRHRTWFAIATAFIGIVIMFANQAGGGWLGVLVALAIPFAAAINWVILKKSGAQLDLAPAVMMGALISCALTLPFSLPFTASGKDILLLAILGLFQLALPCVLLIRGSRYLAAPEIALLGLLEVVMGPLWAWLGAGEALGINTLLGGAIVLAALVINEVIPQSTVQPVT